MSDDGTLAPASTSAADRSETLADGARELVDRLAEEFTERFRRGESPTVAEYAARYPEHAERIRRFLPTVALMEHFKGTPNPSSNDTPSPRSIPERFGEFRVVRVLGRGGMGVVYEAVQESLGRHVALKAIHHVHLNAKRLQRFQRETQAVARLHHTNIVPIFGAGEHEGLPYYVMQYIHGNGLDVLLDAWRRPKSARPTDVWRFVAGIGAQVAEALQYAHEQGILHRDIKPANLLVDDQGSVWVTDFGLAKLTGHEDLTASGDVIGTLRYLAPEALRGENDARSDVYSLGLTLYELLTLTAPFGEVSPSELLRQVSEGQLPRPRRLDHNIPRDLETIVLKAIAREPDHRYASAGALANDLRFFLEDRPIHARRATPIERAWRWSRRNRTMAALMATAACSLLLTAVVGWVGYAITTKALAGESVKRTEAETATTHAEKNLDLSLQVFADLFDKLITNETLLPPPPVKGRRGGPGPRREFTGLGRRGDRPPPPPDGFGRGPGGDDRGPPDLFGMGPGGNPFAPDEGPPRGRGGPGQNQNTELLGSVLSFYERFSRENATDPRLQGEAAWAYRRMGSLYEKLGRDAEAEAANQRAIEMFESLVRRYPGETRYRALLVETYIMADPWSVGPESLERLETQFDRARVLIDDLVSESPDDLEHVQAQIHVYAKLGETLQRLDRFDAAEADYLHAIELGAGLIERAPKPLRARIDQAMIRETLAELQLDRGKPEEARSLLAESASALSAASSEEARSFLFADRLESLADLFERAGDSKRAAEMTELADKMNAGVRRGFPGRGPDQGPPPRPPDWP